jgi:glycosyltransferase involved in cell wall biosynthesis
MATEPLVSVITPVYNGEAFLKECMDSVLAQDYSNFEYIVLNNASTDKTLEIATSYAKRDKRIRVYSNEKLVGVIENHNTAFRRISSESKYCKVVSADDWILPECIKRMVSLAEMHPSIGIVGSYQLSGGRDKWYVRTYGLPYHVSRISGREVCRLHFLNKLDVFGNPTSSLYRSDLVRATECFYPNPTAEADVSALFKHLKDADFGFVHQVLSFERIHEVRQTATSAKLNAYLSSKIGDLLNYGKFCLTDDELNGRLKELLDQYYRYLAISGVNFRSREFWQYHRRRLKELGYPFDQLRFGWALCAKIADLIFNPKNTLEKVVRRTHRARS